MANFCYVSTYGLRALSNVFTVGSCLIIGIIGSAMAASLNLAHLEFKCSLSQDSIVSESALARNMQKVQSYYNRILIVVNLLHYHFEWVCLAHVAFSFLGVINLTYHVMQGIDSLYSFFIQLVWILETVIRMWFINCIPNHIQKKVRFDANSFLVLLKMFFKCDDPLSCLQL